MKKLIVVAIVCIFTLKTFAQKEEISMAPILKQAGKLIDLIERDFGHEIVRMEFDLLQTSKQTFRYLTHQYPYTITAFGDYRIKDLDIKVYKWVNNQWVLIKQDQDEKNVAVLEIKPPFTAEYKIEIIAYKFETGYEIGHYGLIISHP